jgi:TetR/AcrR family transcriptional regulator, transcriptional repressor of aconitase
LTRVTQQHVDARRDAILGAAAQLFARKGISGATMAEIANEAGLSAGAVYRYYSSKEELLRAVFDEAAVRNRELFEGSAEMAATPMQALEMVGRKVWVEMDDPDDLICDIQMALSAARDPEDLGVDISQMRIQLRSLLKDMVVQAQAAGEIDPNVNPDHLAVILQACTAGIQMMKLVPEDNFDVEATFNLFVQMVRGGIASGNVQQGG